MRKPAYTTVEGATAEAAERFGPAWAGLDSLLQEVEAFARIRETDEALSRFVEAGAILKRVLPTVARADRLVREGSHVFDHSRAFDHDDIGLPAALENVPDALAGALAQLRQVEQACRTATKRRATRRGFKLDLVTAALKLGIKPVKGPPGAAWAYAFIALSLAEPVEHSDAVHANREAWQLRCIEADKLLARAR